MRPNVALGALGAPNATWVRWMHRTPLWVRWTHRTPLWVRWAHRTPLWVRWTHPTPLWVRWTHPTPHWVRWVHPTPHWGVRPERPASCDARHRPCRECQAVNGTLT